MSTRSDGAAVPDRSGPAAGRWVPVAVALLAVAVRWNLLGGNVGLHGYHGYDDGVYFASAVAFVHGRMPYADFLLLHPPGIMLALTPFAALARWTGDATAFATARVAFILVGALNTFLVARIARRWGTAAMVTAGTLYALSSAAAYAERLTLLEGLGTLTVLAGVVLLHRASAAATPRWWLVAAGAVLGLGPVIKIWNVVPVLVVLAWYALGKGVRSALVVAGAAVASATLVVLPFAWHAGGRMLRLVVLDQLGRPRTPETIAERLDGVTGVGPMPWTTSEAPRTVLMMAVCAIVALAAVTAWRRRRGRLWVALLVAEVLVILASPSYFTHYAAYSAAAVPLVLGAAVSLVPVGRRVWTAAAACVALGLLTGAVRAPTPLPFPAAQVRRDLPATGCIQSDSPGALALLNVLSRDEERGCDLPVDVSGRTYDIGNRDQQGRPVPRDDNVLWQHYIVTYLTSGSAAVVTRTTGDALEPATARALHADMTVVSVGRVEVLLHGRPAHDAPTRTPAPVTTHRANAAGH
jgi:alpha-1,2-mannosyltransferase